MNKKYDYEKVLRARAERKRGGVKMQPRVVRMNDLMIVREELKKIGLSQQCRDRDVLIVDFLRIYMLRISEVVSLNEKSFDWNKRQFVIDPIFEKNAKEKVYSLEGAPAWFVKELGQYLRRYKHTFIHGYLFPSLSNGSKERPFVKANNWTMYRWNKAVRSSGVSDSYIAADGRVYERMRSHSFRKVGITDLIVKKVPVTRIAAFTHQHPATIMRYYDMFDREQSRQEIMVQHISKIPQPRLSHDG